MPGGLVLMSSLTLEPVGRQEGVRSTPLPWHPALAALIGSAEAWLPALSASPPDQPGAVPYVGSQ